MPLRARRKITAAIAKLTPASVAAITGLTEAISAIDTTSARHGGSTFQEHEFSVWNTAFEVAVMRLASVPGSRSVK